MIVREPIVQVPASLIAFLFAVITLGLGKIWGTIRYYRELAERLESRARSRALRMKGD